MFIKEVKESKEVTDRFLLAFDALYYKGAIKNINAFCEKHDVSRSAIYSLIKERKTKWFRGEWLVFLARDYGVSAHWLLTGEGSMFEKSPMTVLMEVKNIIDDALKERPHRVENAKKLAQDLFE
jgi:hypothetical protein